MSSVLKYSQVSFKSLLRFYKEYKANNIKEKSAILTYYGFIAIFPLSLFSMTILNLLLPHASWGQHFLRATSQIIPIIGQQFFHNLSYSRGIGLSLIVEIILVALGVTAWINELQVCLNGVWHVPNPALKRWPRLKHNAYLIALITASALTMILLFYGDLFVFHGDWLSVVSLLGSCAVNAFWWIAIFRVSLNRKMRLRNFWPAAAVIGVVLQLLARFGGLVLSHELKHLSSLYSSSAIVLGLIVWIYIQIQLIFLISQVGVYNA